MSRKFKKSLGILLVLLLVILNIPDFSKTAGAETIGTGKKTTYLDGGAKTLSGKSMSYISESFKVQTLNYNTEITNSLSINFRVVNSGTTSIDLSKVKIRYYYTVNGEKYQQFWCDWCSSGSGNVTGTFCKMTTAAVNADYYLEIGFTSGAGNLAAGASSEVQCRVAKNDWSNYTQSDDYSFNSSAAYYTDWNKVTGYLDNTLVWGQAPSVKLGIPAGLAWDSTLSGKAKWDAVSNAGGYNVQLKKDGSNINSPVNVNSGTEWDFSSDIRAGGNGSYSFTVTAIGDGLSYSDGDTSGTSPGYDYTAVTGVSLDQHKITLRTGQSPVTLSALVSPDNTSNKKVIWSSNNTNVAAVANGAVTPVAAGTAVVTAKAEDGSCSDTCQVTVYERRIVSPPQTTSLTCEVMDETGDLIKPIDAKLTMEYDGTCTITMQAGEAAMSIQSDGTANPWKDLSRLGFDPQSIGAGIIISSDGTLKVSNLIKGQEYILNTTYDLGNGLKIITGRLSIKLGYDGKASITSTLIDPYGIVIDQKTGKPIKGADIKLYYAGTERNKKAGKIEDTLAQLPVIEDFKPGSNKNPQMSDDDGSYGFMVFPETDYYIVAEKNGYRKYTSPVISVEHELVKWNLAMTAMQPVVILDTTSYAMAPGNIYEIGIKLVGDDGNSVKFYSSNSKIAKVRKLKNGDCLVTGSVPGEVFVYFEVYDRNGKLLSRVSVKVSVNRGIKKHGDSTRVYGTY